MATIKHYTSIEQSKKLLELGLNPESADMHYPDYYFDGYANGPCNTSYKEQIENLLSVYINPDTRRILPCWSIGSLIDIIPSSINFGYENDFHFNLTKTPSGYITDFYEESFGGDTTIDTCYRMIVWLLENGYIKKESNH